MQSRPTAARRSIATGRPFVWQSRRDADHPDRPRSPDDACRRAAPATADRETGRRAPTVGDRADARDRPTRPRRRRRAAAPRPATVGPAAGAAGEPARPLLVAAAFAAVLGGAAVVPAGGRVLGAGRALEGAGGLTGAARRRAGRLAARRTACRCSTVDRPARPGAAGCSPRWPAGGSSGPGVHASRAIGGPGTGSHRRRSLAAAAVGVGVRGARRWSPRWSPAAAASTVSLVRGPRRPSPCSALRRRPASGRCAAPAPARRRSAGRLPAGACATAVAHRRGGRRC